MTGPVAASAETISSACRAVFAADRIATADGFLQLRDSRVAVLSIMGLALAAMITRTLAVLFVLGGLVVLLAWRSSVPLRHLLAHSAVVPATSAVVVLPHAVLMPGDTLVTVGGLAVTDAGLTYVVLFTLRVGVGVALLSLLVSTTPFSAIVAAMVDLRVPTAIVWVIAITYRYLFLFFDELRRLIIARNSRSTGTGGIRTGWRDARRIAGTFLLRTLDRGERVGRGMRARGGANPPSPYRRSRNVDAGDYLLVSVALAAILGAGLIRWIP